jgi:hypothetical protein
MTRQEKMLAKKRGRPATGRGKTIGVRCHDDLLDRIDEWRRSDTDQPTRAEAIRRLIEQSLGGTGSARSSAKKITARKASDLAAREVERVRDQSHPPEEHARRKRALIHGPKEFRDVRADLPKPVAAGAKRSKS